MLKDIDWSLVSFVGVTMVKEYWIYYRLPHVQYWSMQPGEEEKSD
ncbi:hypothetical protein J2R98_001783 [Alkalibacillus filiformis]|uniref:YqzL-like protein n=1 Tax=Alkalibacillus filiformis TaxID=200990 RepID=A0ABU0DU14_9BACI|nr:hypothetical protein [Alkalibacillus filiformis]MDQ0351951.1 hypothetical protein [Alkalibacillus filiformis]